MRVKIPRTLPVQIPEESTRDKTFIIVGELKDPKPKIITEAGLEVIPNTRKDLMIIESKKQED